MSSRTPNDILLRRLTRSTKNNAVTKHNTFSKTSTRLKDMFINSAQREELMTACSKGDLPKVTQLLERKEVGLNPDLIRDSKLRTPLLVACAAGQAAVVRQLVHWGADVNNAMGDIVGNKPLDLAVISNDVDTVLALLEAGATIHQSTQGINADDGLPLPVRLRAATRTPLDLANSRLDLLIKQSQKSQCIKSETMNQVLQIIELLKHFIPNDTRLDALNELTDKIASIHLDEENKQDLGEDIFVMKSLQDVISKITL